VQPGAFMLRLQIFSDFATQSPSFLDWQIRMQQSTGKNNASSIFEVQQILDRLLLFHFPHFSYVWVLNLEVLK
jgi:hypothetical protein